MTEPKEQAVPVVGVEEAVERLTRFTNGEMCAVIYAGSSAPEGGLFTDLRTILQALQGSRAQERVPTEGHGAAVVGVDVAGLLGALDWIATTNFDSHPEAREEERIRDLGLAVHECQRVAREAIEYSGGDQDENRKLGGDFAQQNEPNTLPTVQAETAVVGESQVERWARALYETNAFYDHSGGDLDWHEMASRDGGIRDLHEAMARAAQAVWDAADPDAVSTGEQPGMSEGRNETNLAAKQGGKSHD